MTFGFSLSKQDYAKTKIQHVIKAKRWKFEPHQTDYVDVEIGEMMLYYIPCNDFKDLLKTTLI